MMFTAFYRRLSYVANVAKKQANLAVAALSCLFVASAAQGQTASAGNNAQSKWWFDVEVIVFKHTVDGSQLVEQFDNAVVPIDVKNSRDLILEHLFPNTQQLQRSLANCYVQPNDTIVLPQQTAPTFVIDDTLFQPVEPTLNESSLDGSDLVEPDSLTNFSPVNRQGLTFDAEFGDEFEPELNQQNGQNPQDPDRSKGIALRGNADSNSGSQASPTDTNLDPELQAMQMAFSMPEQLPAQASSPVDTTQSQEQPSNQQLDQAANDIVEQEGFQESLNANLDTPSEDLNLETPGEAEPVAQFAPMVINSEQQELGLIKLHVPQNLGCQFAAEAPNAQQQLFEQWLAEHLPSVNALEAELSAQQAQQQLQALVNGFADEQNEQAKTPLTQSATSETTLAEAIAEESEPDYPDTLPLRYSTLLRQDTQSAYLLPKSELTMRKMSRSIHRRRGISVMSHFAWRQHVPFGRDSAPDFRIMAGKNYSNEFSFEGYPLITHEDGTTSAYVGQIEGEQNKTDSSFYQSSVNKGTVNKSYVNSSSADLVQDINTALAALDGTPLVGESANVDSIVRESTVEESAENTAANILLVPNVPAELTPEQVWELDGVFKVYLQYIGRVPYLHIDSRVNFRQPMLMNEQQFPEPLQSLLRENLSNQNLLNENSTLKTAATPQYFLKPYHFQQLRRVVSRQIHYFDHPMFGMVVQIRRYQIPDFIR